MRPITIAEVSKMFNLTQDTLRYYERIGLLPSVAKNKSGIRDYSVDDCSWVEFIKCMRSAGIPVEVLIEYVSLFKQGEGTAKARKKLLIEQHKLLSEKIVEMQKTLERLNYKIESYERTVGESEKLLRK